MLEFEQRKIKLARSLWDQGAIKFGEFKLKVHERFPEAPLSPIYLNLRTPENPKPGTLSPEDVSDAAALMWEQLQMSINDRPDYFVGIPNAGTPFAEKLSEIVQPNIPLLHLSKETADGKRRIASLVEKDTVLAKSDILKQVVVVDDLITYADSKFEAFDAIEEVPLEVKALVVLVDREQGGAEDVNKFGVSCISVFTLTELLVLYVSEGFISQAHRIEIQRGITDLDEYVRTHQKAS